jgi:hypothetical protein
MLTETQSYYAGAGPSEVVTERDYATGEILNTWNIPMKGHLALFKERFPVQVKVKKGFKKTPSRSWFRTSAWNDFEIRKLEAYPMPLVGGMATHGGDPSSGAGLYHERRVYRRYRDASEALRYSVVTGSSPWFGWIALGPLNQGNPSVTAVIDPDEDPDCPLNKDDRFFLRRSDGGFIPAPDNLDELETVAARFLYPRLKQEMSLINTFIELKDFKSLPRTLQRLRKLPQVLADKKKIYTLMEVLRTGADSYLQKEFNIDPLVSDVCGIFRALVNVQRRINALVTLHGSVQRRHYRFAWLENQPTDEVVGGPPATSYNPVYKWGTADVVTNYRHTYLVEPEQTIFHVEAEMNINFSQYQRENALLLGLLDAFGVNLNPAIVWNAIPWSFVVDWLWSVSSWLNRFQVQNMEPQINVLRYLWSVKRVRKITRYLSIYNDADVQLFPPYLFYQTGKLPVMVWKETTYRRQTSRPRMSSILSSGLSPKEISLGAALVIAQRRPPIKGRPLWKVGT